MLAVGPMKGNNGRLKLSLRGSVATAGALKASVLAPSLGLSSRRSNMGTLLF